jgi:hypothetical protein
MKTITPAQIKKIKILQRQLGLSEEDYRAMLRSVAGVESCKALTGAKIDLVILHLERCRGQGAGASGNNKKAGYSRPMATQPQLDKIQELWERVSTAPPDKRQMALDFFLLKRFKVHSRNWLSAATASRVIEGLKQMAGRVT